MKVRSRLKYLAWLFLPCLLWWIWRDIPLGNIFSILQNLQVWQVLVLILANLGILQLLSTRWWLILRSQGFRLPYLALAGYRLAGFSISYFTPGTQFGGEPLLVYVLNKRHRVPTSTAVASVTLDKLLELLVNFTFLALGMFLILESNLLAAWMIPTLLPVMVGLLCLPLFFLLGLGLGWKPVSWSLDRLPERWKMSAAFHRVDQVIRSAESQSSDYCRKRPGLVVGMYFISLCFWGVMVGEYWLTLRFLGLPLTFGQAVIALTAARLALLIPVPGGLGTLEASQVLALQALGFEPVFGASIALLIRGRDIIFAGIGLWLTAVYTQKRLKTESKPLEAEYS